VSRRAKALSVLAALPIPALSVFPFIFSHFSLIWHHLASPYTRLGVSKGANRLTSPCRLKNIDKKGSPIHVAPAYARSREGPNYFGSYVRSLPLHFCKRLFPGLEPMTSWSQGNSFTAAPGLPFI
jgi:hypothetical protein